MRAVAFALSLLAAASLLLALAATRPASASGGLACAAGEKAVALSVDAGVSHGMGGSLFNLTGDLRISHAAVPEGRRQIGFSHENVAQYWLDGRELRLTLYREDVDDAQRGFVKVEVRTVMRGNPDEGAFIGRFFVTVYEAGGKDDTGEFRAEGRIECFVE